MLETPDPAPIPELPGLDPAEQAWLETALANLRPETGPGLEAPAQAQQEDEGELGAWQRLDPLAALLFDPAEPLPVPLPGAVDRTRLALKLARACLSAALSDGPVLRGWTMLGAVANLHRQGAISERDLPGITECFLLLPPEVDEIEPDGEPLWCEFETMAAGLLARPDLGLRLRLGLGLALLAADLMPARRRRTILGHLLAPGALPEPIAQELLRRLVASHDLFVPFESGEELDPRPSVLLGGSPEGHREAELALLDQLEETVNSAEARSEAGLAAVGLDACGPWLRTGQGRRFLREALLSLTPRLVRSYARAGEEDDRVSEKLAFELARRAEQAGAPPMLGLALFPAILDMVIEMPPELRIALLTSAARTGPERRNDNRGRRRKSGPGSGLEPEMEGLFQECVGYIIGLVDARIAPRKRLFFAELASLSDSRLEALRGEVSRARTALRRGQTFELSPTATLLALPELPWHDSRLGRRAALGVRVAAARRLTERGEPLTRVVDRVRHTWDEDDLRSAGTDLSWAVRIVLDHPERFEEEVVGLASRLERTGLGRADVPRRVFRCRAELHGHGAPSRTVEMAAEHTLRDLHCALQQAFGWNLQAPCTFEVAGQFYSYPCAEKDGDLLVKLLSELELHQATPISYVFGTLVDTVELEVRCDSLLASEESSSVARVLASEGESPRLEQLFRPA